MAKKAMNRALGSGSEVIFTLFQQEGMPAAQFENDLRMVRQDLDTLKSVMEPENN